MALPVTDVLLSDAASAALDALDKKAVRDPKAKSIATRARSLRPMLLRDALRGEVAKKPLPLALVRKHGVENLFVEDLPDFWWLLYTIVRAGSSRFVVVIEVVPHSQYDKWFPNRGK